MTLIDVTLGIDIGGTNTVYGYVDKDGNCLHEASIPTNGDEPAERFFERFYEAESAVFEGLKSRCRLLGIGMGAPNANYYRGTIEQPPNLKWGVVKVVQTMRKYYEVPVVLTNDANAAAIGEMVFGAAKGMKDFIVITLGTGLGSGIVANGQIICGADGFAGEIGHTIYDPAGRDCGCGRKGCLEAYASASGIRRTVGELLALRTVASELRDITPNSLTAKMISEAAQRGDAIALEAFEMTGEILGLKLADSVAHTSPEAIILFGGLAAAGDLLFLPTHRSLEKHLFPIFRNKVKLLPSGLPTGNAAVLGSSALIWNELHKQQG
jgi:glucokinase